MVYNNLIKRFLLSIILFVVYLWSLLNFYFLLILGTVIYFIIFFEIFNYFKKYTISILFYLTISYFCFAIYLFNFFDLFNFNILIYVIISFDTFSYFVGKTFGKNNIFKIISPNKTIEGYIGGFLITNLLFIIYLYYYSNLFHIYQNLLLINSFILFSLLGDLLQSFFKRKNNIKDSSNFLPGHGGFFDRFDSFLSSIILLFVYSYFIL